MLWLGRVEEARQLQTCGGAMDLKSTNDCLPSRVASAARSSGSSAFIRGGWAVLSLEFSHASLQGGKVCFALVMAVLNASKLQRYYGIVPSSEDAGGVVLCRGRFRSMS